jgi:hypothetical protein
MIDGKNPDFVSTVGARICLEVSDKRYKSQLDKRNYGSWEAYESDRKNHFARHDWKCGCIWTDMNEEEVLDEIGRVER